MKRDLLITQLAAVLIANCLLLTPAHAGCGLNWSMPIDHFEGVDRFGYVNLWYKVGEIKVDDGFILPLHVNFNSSRQTTSPYLGAGWSLALLESQIVQEDENRFRLVEPSGWGRVFRRKNRNDTVLEGQGGWKAEIRGDRISAWARCGTRLNYHLGQIVGIKTEAHDIQFVHYAGHLAEVRSAMKTLLRIERNAKGEVTGLVLDGDDRVEFNLGVKPRVEHVDGQNLLAGVERAATLISLNSGSQYAFEYKVDNSVRPVIVAEGDREMTWNPEDGRILSDGATAYSHEEIEDNQITGLVQISVDGTERVFRENVRTKKREYTLPDGVRISQEYFLFQGTSLRLRNERVERNGKEIAIKRYLYNEEGFLSELRSNDNVYYFCGTQNARMIRSSLP